MKAWFMYFRLLIPSTQGFSAYRFPGIMVHLPVAMMIILAGIFLCKDHIWLFPLIVAYVIIGLYIGRDLAIYAHYNLLIVLAVLLGVLFFPAYSGGVREFIEALSAPYYGIYSFLVSAIIITGFFFYVRHWVIIERQSEKEIEAGYPSPLHYAAQTGNVKRCAELLACVANLDLEGETGRTPLHLAAANGHTEVVSLLLELGVSVNLPTKDEIERNRDCTALHYAAENGHDKMVELLLKRGAQVNALSFHKYTPLHYAALHGHGKVAQILVEAGADLKAVTADGYTAFHLAESFGHKKVAELLRKNSKI